MCFRIKVENILDIIHSDCPDLTIVIKPHIITNMNWTTITVYVTKSFFYSILINIERSQIDTFYKTYSNKITEKSNKYFKI